MLTLFNLLHNEGLPELMRARYCDSALSTTFFIVFVVVVQFFILNIMIGRFYLAYQEYKTYHFLKNRAQEYDVLSSIFDLIVNDRESVVGPAERTLKQEDWRAFANATLYL